jgi:PadR family transcriptional regulator PadR
MISAKRPDIDGLVEKWEEVYKRGLFTFWLLMVLQQDRAYPYEIPDAIKQISLGTVTVNGNSVYRSMRRFEKLGLVQSEMENSTQGPARKYYTLSRLGGSLLREFIRRNILVFSSPVVAKQIADVFMENGIARDDNREAG